MEMLAKNPKRLQEFSHSWCLRLLNHIFPMITQGSVLEEAKNKLQELLSGEN